jgi:hypothetical protein
VDACGDSQHWARDLDCGAATGHQGGGHLDLQRTAPPHQHRILPLAECVAILLDQIRQLCRETMPGMLKPDLRMVLRELRRSLLHHRAGAQVLGLANADRSGDDSRRLIGREVAEVPAVEVYKARMMEKRGGQRATRTGPRARGVCSLDVAQLSQEVWQATRKHVHDSAALLARGSQLAARCAPRRGRRAPLSARRLGPQCVREEILAEEEIDLVARC